MYLLVGIIHLSHCQLHVHTPPYGVHTAVFPSPIAPASDPLGYRFATHLATVLLQPMLALRSCLAQAASELRVGCGRFTTKNHINLETSFGSSCASALLLWWWSHSLRNWVLHPLVQAL